MFESIISFDQNLHDISQTHALEKKSLPSLQHFLSPCLTVFALGIFYTRATQLYSFTASNSAKIFRPQNVWLRSDEQSQLPSIQDPSSVDKNQLWLIEYNAQALGGPTDMILETTIIWFCQLEETSPFYFLLNGNKRTTVYKNRGMCPAPLRTKT